MGRTKKTAIPIILNTVPSAPVMMPAVASPEPVSVPAEFLIFVLPILPQMMAGIPDSKPKQTRLRIPKTKLAIAMPELSGWRLEFEVGMGAGLPGGSGSLMVSLGFGFGYLLLMYV